MNKSVQEVLDTFSLQLQNIFNMNLVGVYLTGSIALKGYFSSSSDIDFTVVLSQPLTKDMLSEITEMHQSLKKQFKRPILEGQYVTIADLGKLPDQIPPVITYYNGSIKYSYEGINPITWFTLKNHGVTVYGKPARKLEFDISKEMLLRYVKENVNTYWTKWVTDSRNLLSTRGLYSFAKPSVEWGVLGISRMYFTLREHDIASKENAGKYVLRDCPERYKDILTTAIAIRTNCRLTKKMTLFTRRRQMLEFIEYLIGECNNHVKGTGIS